MQPTHRRTTDGTLRLPTRGAIVILLTAALLVIALLSATPSPAQSAEEFPGLEAGQRVYDRTGGSLSQPQVADLQRRLDELASAGADAVVYVRALDATPEETLEQVEALQQAWVTRTGTDQDTAAAVLINRNQEDPEDARAGVFVGRTFREGNVPEEEQRAIVDDALIPPLRDGDVHASLAAAVERLTSSVRSGPPPDPAQEWAEGAVTSWLPWAAIALTVILLAGAVLLFRRRQAIAQPDLPATTVRPGDLPPALFAALVAGAPQGSTISATLLDLATRGTVAIEQEKEGGRWHQGTVRVRLLDSRAVRGPVETALWTALQDRVDGDVVPHHALQKIAGDPKPVTEAVKDQMRQAGWLDLGAGGPRAGLVVIAVLAGVLAMAAFIVVGISEAIWPAIIWPITLVLVIPVALVLFGRYSRLSRAGQEAAIPWRAYREGIEQAANDDTAVLDLDAVLPDVVAANLGSAWNKRIEAAGESGQTLRAFGTSTDGSAFSPAMYASLWVAFQSSTTSSTGGAGSTVSGVGAGGGGGAAGST